MTDQTSTDKKPDLPHSPATHSQQNRRGGRRQHRNRWNSPGGGASTKNVGKTPGLEYDIFSNTGAHNAAMFHRSLKQIADYIQLNYGNEVSEAIRTMTPVIINIPAVPQDKQDPTDPSKIIKVSDIDIYLWKEKHKKASTKFDKYETDMARAFILIFHQCTPNLKNDIKAADTFPAIRVAQDPIVLLKLIRSLCCSYDAKTQSVMDTVASHKRLFTYYQRDGNDNHKYFQEFSAHVKTLETYGGIGAIGITPTFLTAKLKELAAAREVSSATAPSDAECMAAIKLVRDEFLGFMLSGANRDRYATLKTDLHNQYGYGKDLYPKSPDQCLTLLNRHSDTPTRSPCHKEPKPAPIKQEEEALVFAQGTSDKSGAPKQKDDGTRASSLVSSSPSKPRVTNVRCRTCGKLGHTLSVCPESKPPAQIHAMLAAADDAVIASDEESVIILTQIHTSHVGADPDYLLAQDVPRSAIDSDLVLLDSQLTVNLFTNPAHVKNICPTRNPIQVHCNSGTMSTTTVADFGNTPVYFNSRRIANVLSLYRLGRKFRVTYNSIDRNGVFQVHMKHGVVAFKPTPKGLNALNLKDNPDAAFLLVNDADV